MRKKVWMIMALVGSLLLCSCGQKEAETEEKTQIQVFVAASLGQVMEEMAEEFQKEHPEVEIVFQADSSGTLLAQIQEGYECDIFFSAAQKQMDTLEGDGLILDEKRADVLNNQVVVVARKDSDTAVTSLKEIGKANSIALAGGSVPVGKYTREAMCNLNMITRKDAVDQITTAEIAEQLGNVEISEQDNVSKVLMAVVEGSCEVGTTYYSDTYGYEDEIQILEKVGYDLTGNVIYPVCRVINEEADEKQSAAADAFYEFLLSDQAKEIFEAYYFDTDL